ncbi:MAG: hypothetical protein HY985_16860 [Magnetospirillum sp.]|nr:hypothetical protein [Magnetospirillum sp.]
MGYDNGAFAQRRMETRDVIWLAALGTAARRPARMDDVCRTIDSVAAGPWRPVPELVIGCVEEMIRGGHLEADAGRPDPELRLMDHGRGTLALLLGLATARPSSPLGQVALRLKLAFLDLVEAPERGCILDEAIATYKLEVSEFENRCRDCIADGCFGALWRAGDGERLRQELDLLQRIAAAAVA